MGAILFPSLALLFSLVLRGRFDPGHSAADAAARAGPLMHARAQGLAARLALAGLIGGLGLLTLADAPSAHLIGVLCLRACALLGVRALDPAGVAGEEP